MKPEPGRSRSSGRSSLAAPCAATAAPHGPRPDSDEGPAQGSAGQWPRELLTWFAGTNAAGVESRGAMGHGARRLHGHGPRTCTAAHCPRRSKMWSSTCMSTCFASHTGIRGEAMAYVQELSLARERGRVALDLHRQQLPRFQSGPPTACRRTCSCSRCSPSQQSARWSAEGAGRPCRRGSGIQEATGGWAVSCATPEERQRNRKSFHVAQRTRPQRLARHKRLEKQAPARPRAACRARRCRWRSAWLP